MSLATPHLASIDGEVEPKRASIGRCCVSLVAFLAILPIVSRIGSATVDARRLLACFAVRILLGTEIRQGVSTLEPLEWEDLKP